MSTGFFLNPMAVENAGQEFLTNRSPSERGEYGVQSSFLSFCFALHSTKPPGIALVDTAAQHGLVGEETLKQHDILLQQHHQLRVQWSHEPGGMVRGVCGSEEHTSLAYVPIGLGGKSGILKVQVVPGDIPFLIPAYFLSDLQAVIDMKNATILYMALGVTQKMIRLPTGHVAVSTVEFGPGFTVPANHRCFHSQAWTSDTAHLSEHALPHAFEFSTMGPVATLALTALCLRWLGGQTDHDGSGTPTSTPTSSRNSEAPRTARATSLLACTARAINPGLKLTPHQEDRVRPRACIRGRGRYLVPELEPSPHCTHGKTSHGANKHCSYHRYDQCGQEQTMPLTPLQDLQHWNDTLVYVKCAFFDAATKKLETKTKKAESAQASAESTSP